MAEGVDTGGRDRLKSVMQSAPREKEILNRKDKGNFDDVMFLFLNCTLKIQSLSLEYVRIRGCSGKYKH